MKEITDIISGAIHSAKAVHIKLWHTYYDSVPVVLNPYIYGLDILGYEFVWGCLARDMTYYKIFIDLITDATITEKEFIVDKSACYQYAMEEDHYAVLQGFGNIYAGAAEQEY